MGRLIVPLCFLVTVILPLCQASLPSVEDQLLKNLSLGTSARLYPPLPREGDTAITISCNRFLLDRILGLDQRTQELSVISLIELSWYDDRLVWDRKVYPKIRQLHVPASDVWLPDVSLINGPGSQVPFDDAGQEDKVFVLITPDGVVKYRLYIKLASTCLTNVKMFPFDHQICKLIFSSWTEGSSTISVINPTTVEWNADLNENSDWILDGANSSAVTVLKDIPTRLINSTVTLQQLRRSGFEVSVNLHRKTHFYLYNVFIPITTLSLLTVANIRVPARYYQDKIIMGLSTFIAQSWYLIMLSPELPVTQRHLPLIAAVVVLSMAFTCFTLIMSIVVIHIHLQTPQTRPVTPLWLQRICSRIVHGGHRTSIDKDHRRGRSASWHQGGSGSKNRHTRPEAGHDNTQNIDDILEHELLQSSIKATASKQSQTDDVHHNDSEHHGANERSLSDQYDDEGFCETSHNHPLSTPLVEVINAIAPKRKRLHRINLSIDETVGMSVTPGDDDVFPLMNHQTNIATRPTISSQFDPVPAPITPQVIEQKHRDSQRLSRLSTDFSFAREWVDNYRLSIDIGDSFSRRFSRNSRKSRDSRLSQDFSSCNVNQSPGFLSILDPSSLNLIYILLMHEHLKNERDDSEVTKKDSRTSSWELVADAIDVVFFWVSCCVLLFCISVFLVLDHRRSLICTQ